MINVKVYGDRNQLKAEFGRSRRDVEERLRGVAAKVISIELSDVDKLDEKILGDVLEWDRARYRARVFINGRLVDVEEYV